VVIGSDIPDIRRHHIWQAFRVLDRHQFVFGPARDGGYWLVGARRRPAEPYDIFQEVRWSTEHALADTLANLGPHQAGPPLPVLEDVDDSESWRRWRRNPFNRLHVNLKAARFGPALTKDGHRPYSPP
jgi:glycosyltransferase A (GT-A) superfamily protein (DUF2064 family)